MIPCIWFDVSLNKPLPSLPGTWNATITNFLFLLFSEVWVCGCFLWALPKSIGYIKKITHFSVSEVFPKTQQAQNCSKAQRFCFNAHWPELKGAQRCRWPPERKLTRTQRYQRFNTALLASPQWKWEDTMYSQNTIHTTDYTPYTMHCC